MSAVPPPVVNSPLGTDPAPVQQTATNNPPAPAPAAKTPPAVPTSGSGKTLTQAEYDALQAKASNFDAIANDPVIAEKVVDHFRARGRVGQQSPQPPAQEPNGPQQTPPPPQLDPRIQQRIDAMTQRVAQLEVENFRAKHPDMDSLKDEMVPLMHRGISLEDAYRFSKAVKAQTMQKPAQAAPAMPTAESNQSAGIVDDSDNLSAVEKKINDPKATPRLDDVIALAWQAAKRNNGS